jgi:hypothetical protein
VSIQPDQRNDVDITLQPIQQAGVTTEPVHASVPTTVPQPTKSPVAMFTILAAVGICGAIHLALKRE